MTDIMMMCIIIVLIAFAMIPTIKHFRGRVDVAEGVVISRKRKLIFLKGTKSVIDQND